MGRKGERREGEARKGGVTDRKGWSKDKERASKSKRGADLHRQGGKWWSERKRKSARKKQRELVGCGLPGSDFHILPIATPKSLIVWPQTKYCRDHSTPASRRLAAENLAV